MFKIQVGQPKAGKTGVVKEKIKSCDGKKVIFDFNDDFSDIEGVEVDLEFFHPLIDELSLDEVKILNAGYLNSSRCLYRKAEDIFRENKTERLSNIIQDSIERLNASLNDKWGEVEYARELSHRIPLKVSPKQSSINNIIKMIEENETVIIKSKSIHSDHLRAMMFMIIYKISIHESLKVNIIADEVSTLFFKGNLKLLFEVIDVSNIEILMSCNRPSNIPIHMKPFVSEWSLFKNNDKSEIKYLRSKFDIGRNIDIERIPIGEYQTVKQLSMEDK